MNHDDFHIGMRFLTEGARGRGRQWQCTDIGTRVITAIEVDPNRDPSWYNGPPYAVVEHVFDENDFPDLTPTKAKSAR